MKPLSGRIHVHLLHHKLPSGGFTRKRHSGIHIYTDRARASLCKDHTNLNIHRPDNKHWLAYIIRTLTHIITCGRMSHISAREPRTLVHTRKSRARIWFMNLSAGANHTSIRLRTKEARIYTANTSAHWLFLANCPPVQPSLGRIDGCVWNVYIAWDFCERYDDGKISVMCVCA